MQVLSSILQISSTFIQFLKKHPKFFLGLIVAAFIILFFKQCETNRQLKGTIERMEVDVKNESNRTLNNINALKDSVKYYEDNFSYLKDVVRVKDSETVILTKRLSDANQKISQISKELNEKSDVKNVFVVDVSSQTVSTDATTNVTKVDSLEYSLEVKESNSVFDIETKTWFTFEPYGDTLRLTLLDKYGPSKSTQITHGLNFTLNIGQLELPNGNTRILINPVDIYGKDIPSSVLNIPYADGVNFIDVEPKTIPIPVIKRKRTGFGAMIGPTLNLGYGNGVFTPSIGIGLTVGYKIF